MKENTRLGVSIPTYKRPDELRKCLTSVKIAAEPYSVPIFIADDAVDGTNAEVLQELKEEYPFVHITKNKENLGIDRNIQQAANICPCDYVWLLGEDDRMLPHGVKTVLRELEGEDVPFLYVNYSAADNDVRFLIKERSLPIRKNQRMAAEDFYRGASWSMGFIGACVIQKASWNPIDETPYLDTFFAHVGRIMEGIYGSEVIMIAEPLILNRCGSPEAFSWTGDAVEVFTGWEKMTRKLEGTYSKESGQESLAHFQKAHGIGSLKLLMYLRAAGVYNLKMKQLLVRTQDYGYFYRMMSWVIALSPPGIWKVVRALLMAHRKLRSPLPTNPK